MNFTIPSTDGRYRVFAMTGLAVAIAAFSAVGGDYNGDGFDDAAFGVVFEDLGGPVPDAGAVIVIYGSPPGTGGLATAATGGLPATLLHQNVGGVAEVADPGDLFGSALASGDVNGDGFDDLVVGVPGETTPGGVAAVGAVHVFFGAAGGLNAAGGSAFISSALWAEPREAGDGFGRSVAVGDFNGDGVDDIIIATPFEDVGAVADAGLLHVLFGIGGGGFAAGPTFSQAVFGDPIEAADFLGLSLAVLDVNGDGFVDVAAGAPGEDYVIGGAGTPNVGMVNILEGGPGGIGPSAATPAIVQSMLATGDPSEADDMFGFSLAGGDVDGDGFDELVASAHLEDVGGTADAGAIDVIAGSAGGLMLGVALWIPEGMFGPGASEPGDAFGVSVAIADFDGDGFADVVAGKAGEEGPAGPANSGEVTILYGAPGGPGFGGSADWGQGSPGILDGPELDDHFGRTVAAGDFNGDGFGDLIAAAPQENVGAVAPGVDTGMVNVLYGGPAGLSAVGDQIWHQNRPGVPEANGASDAFGLASEG